MERPIWDEAFDDNASGGTDGSAPGRVSGGGPATSGNEGSRSPIGREDGARSPRDYDWLDDAFDDAKPDPLAAKGMTGCSRLAVLLAVIAVVAIIAVVAFAIGTASLLVSSINSL